MTRASRPARAAEPAAAEPGPAPARPPPPAVTRDEIDLLIRRAGLTLNAGQKADLAVAFQHLVALAARLPRSRPLADAPAFTFHPPLPPAVPEAAAKPEKPSRRKTAQAAAKPPPAATARPASKPGPTPGAKARSKAGPKAQPKAGSKIGQAPATPKPAARQLPRPLRTR